MKGTKLPLTRHQSIQLSLLVSGAAKTLDDVSCAIEETWCLVPPAITILRNKLWVDEVRTITPNDDVVT